MLANKIQNTERTQQIYDEIIGREACKFVDTCEIFSATDMEKKSDLLAENFKKLTKTGYQLEYTKCDLSSFLYMCMFQNFLKEKHSFLPIPVEKSGLLSTANLNRWGKLGNFISDVKNSSIGFEGENSFGAVFMGSDLVNNLAEKLVTRWSNPSFRTNLSIPNPNMEIFVRYHEAKHAEMFLAPHLRIQRHLPVLNKLQMHLTEEQKNEEEIAADFNGIAASNSLCKRGIAREIADIRALSFALSAWEGTVSFKHWTVWALDVWADDLNQLAKNSNQISVLEIGDMLDGESKAHSLAVTSDERKEVKNAFLYAKNFCKQNNLDFFDFLKLTAKNSTANRWTTRCQQAVSNTLDIEYYNARSELSFSTDQTETKNDLGNIVKRYTINCEQTEILSFDSGDDKLLFPLLETFVSQDIRSILDIMDRKDRFAHIDFSQNSKLLGFSSQQFEFYNKVFGSFKFRNHIRNVLDLIDQTVEDKIEYVRAQEDALEQSLFDLEQLESESEILTVRKL